MRTIEQLKEAGLIKETPTTLEVDCTTLTEEEVDLVLNYFDEVDGPIDG